MLYLQNRMLAMEEFFQICIKFKESFAGILLFDTLYQPEKAPRQVYHMFIGLNSGGRETPMLRN